MRCNYKSKGGGVNGTEEESNKTKAELFKLKRRFENGISLTFPLSTEAKQENYMRGWLTEQILSGWRHAPSQ